MQTQIVTQKRKPKGEGRNIPVETLLYYQRKGLKHIEIANIVGIARETVTRKLSQCSIERIDQFKTSMADTLLYHQMQILDTLTPKAYKTMSPRDRVVAFGILYDKYRLQTGQSTTNIQALTALITSIHAPQPQPVVVSAQPEVFGHDLLAEQETIDVPVQAPDPVTPDDSGG